MKLYAGIDLHSTNIYLGILGDNGVRIYGKRLPTNSGEILEALAPYQSEIESVSVESTYNWYWLVDKLQSAGYRVKLAHPLGMAQYKGLKNTNDKTDAYWLAQQDQLGILPCGYIYPQEQRGLREKLRKRMKLVRQRTQTILSMQSVFKRYENKKVTCSQLTRLTAEALSGLITDKHCGEALLAQKTVLDAQVAAVGRLEEALLQELKSSNEDFIRLKTVPGVGEILGMNILLETGDISRFCNSRHYSSYCRCVSSQRISNGRRKGRNNRKNGNVHLAWALSEAAHIAARSNEKIKAYYQRRLNKTHKMSVFNAIANKLSKSIYYILRDKTEFNISKTFI